MVATAVMDAVLALVLAGVFWGVSRPAATGALGPNGLAGIRIPATMASPEAWRAGHAAAVGPSRTACGVGGVGLVLTLVALVGPAWLALVVSTVALVAVVVLLARAVVAAHRAARAVSGRREGP